MIFNETPIQGVYHILPETIVDERGFFARTFCSNEFAKHGLITNFVQCNISYNSRAGILRGMHYQREPHGEVKVVRCTLGSVYDVVLDLRPNSASFKQWFGLELSAVNHYMLYMPSGVAHGFQTLSQESEVLYMMGEFYHPESATGVRWDDPLFGIVWPDTEQRILSPQDTVWPDYSI